MPAILGKIFIRFHTLALDENFQTNPRSASTIPARFHVVVYMVVVCIHHIQQPTYLYNSLFFPSHFLSTRSSDFIGSVHPIYVRTSLGKI